MYIVILSIQNVVLFIKNCKLDIGVKIRTLYEFQSGLGAVQESFSWKAFRSFDTFETD
jgi:hypothetical protein